MLCFSFFIYLLSLLVCKLFSLIGRDELIDYLIQSSGHYVLYSVGRIFYAMIGNSSLREIISPYLFRAVSRPDLSFPDCSFLVMFLLKLHLVKS